MLRSYDVVNPSNMGNSSTGYPTWVVLTASQPKPLLTKSATPPSDPYKPNTASCTSQAITYALALGPKLLTLLTDAFRKGNSSMTSGAVRRTWRQCPSCTSGYFGCLVDLELQSFRRSSQGSSHWAFYILGASEGPES